MQYTTEFCEREYDNRAMIPEHPRIFERWSRAGKAFRDRHQDDPGTRLHVSYGDSDGERLDYFSCGVPGSPLFVFIHGGYWRALDKNDFSWIAEPFLDAHIDVALLNHALCPQVGIDTIVQQMREACTWLCRHADELGFDRELITVGGHSAGAHLTAMLMCTRWSEWSADLPPDLVKAGVLVSGVYDLEPLMHAPFLNGDLKLDADAVARLSPIGMAPDGLAPVITAVGGRESSEFRRQTRMIAESWSRNFRADIPMPQANHLDILDAFADASNPLPRAAIELCLRPYHELAGTLAMPFAGMRADVDPGQGAASH